MLSVRWWIQILFAEVEYLIMVLKDCWYSSRKELSFYHRASSDQVPWDLNINEHFAKYEFVIILQPQCQIKTANICLSSENFEISLPRLFFIYIFEKHYTQKRKTYFFVFWIERPYYYSCLLFGAFSYFATSAVCKKTVPVVHEFRKNIHFNSTFLASVFSRVYNCRKNLSDC